MEAEAGASAEHKKAHHKRLAGPKADKKKVWKHLSLSLCLPASQTASISIPYFYLTSNDCLRAPLSPE